jgi:hypothetical protein
MSCYINLHVAIKHIPVTDQDGCFSHVTDNKDESGQLD